jgi:carboxymethylenebutenolidase
MIYLVKFALPQNWSILMQKIIIKTLFGLLAFIVGLILLIAVSIPLAAIGNEARLAAVTNTTIPGLNGEPDVRAYVARPAGAGTYPVVIMIHEFFGLNESIVSKAEGLAQEGYIVIAPDTFRGSTSMWIPRAIYHVITTAPAQVNRDLDSVFAWVESQPDMDASRVGTAGFCYGGRASLAYSLHNERIAVTVIFYGSPETDPEVVKNLPGPVLGIYGGADTSIPLEDVALFEQTLSTLGIPHEISIYEGQPHAFMTDMDGIRAGGAQGQAWAQMLGFLDANLKNQSGYRGGQTSAQLLPFDWQYYARLVYEHALGTASHQH